MDREGRMQHFSALGIWASNLVTVIKSGKKYLEELNVSHYFNGKIGWKNKSKKPKNITISVGLWETLFEVAFPKVKDVLTWRNIAK